MSQDGQYDENYEPPAQRKPQRAARNFASKASSKTKGSPHLDLGLSSSWEKNRATLDWSMVALSLMIACMLVISSFLSNPTYWSVLGMTFGVVSVSKASKMGLLSPTHHEARTSTPVTYFPLVHSSCCMMYLRKSTAEHWEIRNLVTWKCWIGEGKSRACMQPTVLRASWGPVVGS